MPKLPLAYALVGTLYLGMLLKNAYPDYTIGHLTNGVEHPYLRIWALLSLLFWIPMFRKKPVFSLLHSSVFFFSLMKSLFLQFFTPFTGNDMARNNMKIYSVSVILTLLALLLVALISLLIGRFKRRNGSTHI